MPFAPLAADVEGVTARAAAMSRTAARRAVGVDVGMGVGVGSEKTDARAGAWRRTRARGLARASYPAPCRMCTPDDSRGTQ